MKRLVRHARVLVVDGANALVLRNEGDAAEADLQLIRTYSQENPPTRLQGSDRPGRTNDSLGRQAAVEDTDWHEAAEADFVRGVARDMDRDLKNGEFEALVVVAAPVALGTYRKAASAAVAKATLIEINKDLVKHAPAEIAAQVVKALDSV